MRFGSAAHRRYGMQDKLSRATTALEKDLAHQHNVGSKVCALVLLDAASVRGHDQAAAVAAKAHDT